MNEIISVGKKIDEISKEMRKAGNRKTMLSMVANKGYDLKIWAVGKGYLIAVFKEKDKKITGLTFYFCSHHPKTLRCEF